MSLEATTGAGAIARVLGHYRSTLLGGVSGTLVVDDSLQDVIARPDDWTAWIRLLIGALSIVVGAFSQDAKRSTRSPLGSS